MHILLSCVYIYIYIYIYNLVYILFNIFKIMNTLPGAVAHFCNHSYSGGRDQVDCSLKSAPGK
jgi:hypothetical protein